MLSKQAAKMFKSDGWAVVGHNPLKIVNTDSSNAVGFAAEIVLEFYEARIKKQYDILREAA